MGGEPERERGRSRAPDGDQRDGGRDSWRTVMDAPVEHVDARTVRVPVDADSSTGSRDSSTAIAHGRDDSSTRADSSTAIALAVSSTRSSGRSSLGSSGQAQRGQTGSSA